MSYLRSDLVNLVRRELQDTGGSPLWATQQIYDDLAAGMQAYSQYFPVWSSTAATSTLNQTAMALGAGVQAVRSVVVDGVTVPQVPDEQALYEPAFRNQVSQTIVQPVTPFGSAATHGQAWAYFNGAVNFRYGLSAGRAITVYYSLSHVLPSDDVTAITPPDSDVELLVLYACDRLVQSAATDAIKRGAPGAWVEGRGGIGRYAERYQTALRDRRSAMRMRQVTVLQ